VALSIIDMFIQSLDTPRGYTCLALPINHVMLRPLFVVTLHESHIPLM
jgi:hypothetical protein